MKTANAILVTTSVLLLLVGYGFSQPGRGRGCGGWCQGSEYYRMYDPKTVETVSGTVEKIETMTPMKGMSAGIHMMLKSEKETISVHLGPSWYLEGQDTQIAAGDKLEIKGSRITYEGKPAIIAAEVKKGDETLKLRDESGFPAWAGWRRGR